MTREVEEIVIDTSQEPFFEFKLATKVKEFARKGGYLCVEIRCGLGTIKMFFNGDPQMGYQGSIIFKAWYGEEFEAELKRGVVSWEIPMSKNDALEYIQKLQLLIHVMKMILPAIDAIPPEHHMKRHWDIEFYIRDKETGGVPEWAKSVPYDARTIIIRRDHTSII